MFTEAQFITAKTYSRARYPSVGGWINKLWYIQTMEYYSTLKKKWAIISWKNMEEPLMHITKWKKPIWKGYILYDFNYMTLWKRQNYRDSTKISGCQSARSQHGRSHPWQRSCGRGLMGKVDQDSRGPLDLLEHLPPKPKSVCYTTLFWH